MAVEDSLTSRWTANCSCKAKLNSVLKFCQEIVIIKKYNDMLNTLPETGSWGSYWVYTGLREAALGELPASGKALSIAL